MRAYKDSGIEWLGEIPEHWEIKPLRAILNQRNEQNNDLKLQTILSLIKDIGVIPYEEKGNVGNKSKEDLQSYKIARINDLVLNKMNAVIGSLGVSAYNGLVSPIYLVFYIDNPKYLMSYYYYLFQIKSVQKFLKTFAYGIMEIRESIDYLDFKKMFLPTPPLEEQKAIADFLDSKCKQIESFVDKKQKLITLLNEKKQALINECVTKGLNKNIKYKDSGIKHLGKIPKHWKIKKFKHLAIICNGKEQLQVASDNGVYPIYGSGGIIGKTNQFLYNKQSVLLGRKGTIDKPLFVEIPFWAIDTMFYTKILDIVHSKYFYYLCLTIDFKIYTSGSAIPSMTQSDLAEIIFPFAPLQEQKQIAEFLDSEISKIDSIIEKIKKQIELIKEYKSTLINQAVCGRINL
ncbi:restriction endonuclease subunit S [uncultured Campylobacter sp.]|uniref:restriction endonuclease subunit S n=1 Tax=uncultured Campylobacter sp. TaxID=218934 RepID=UPI00260CB635|nr:restriction endonuclease subunit S [uncultured Campylobacter sp.]